MKIYFSVVTECEFISGVKEEHEMTALKFLNSGRFIAVDSNIARIAGKLRRKQRQKGRKVKTPD